MSDPQTVRTPLEPIQAARRKLFIQGIRDILPTTQEELRKLEEQHRDESEEFLLGVTRSGFHVFNAEGEPVDYVPCDHWVYVISGTPPPQMPVIEDGEQRFNQTVEHATLLGRKLSLTCPMCGKPLHTSVYKATDPLTDIAVVSCPHAAEGKKICMEYPMKGQL